MQSSEHRVTAPTWCVQDVGAETAHRDAPFAVSVTGRKCTKLPAVVIHMNKEQTTRNDHQMDVAEMVDEATVSLSADQQTI